MVSPENICQCAGLVHLGEGYSIEFEVKVGDNQGSIVSPLFYSGVPLEDHYAGHIVIIPHSLEECVRRLLIWKETIEEKGLKINAGRT